MAAQFVGQVGQNAFKHVEQNVNRWVNFSALKHYFNVSNGYVVNKLFLVLFPWRHKPWSRRQAVGPSGQEGWYLPPRDDINSPDMYIPVMALVTYILLSTLLAGLRGQFQPELLGYTASKAGVVVIVEILLLKLGCYFLSISNESQLLDLVAYSGYKFVGIIVTVAIAELVNGGKGTGGWVGWSIFLYTFLANSLFLVSFIHEKRASEALGSALSLMLKLDAFPTICPTPGKRRRCKGTDADGFEDEAQPENKFSLRLLLRSAADVYDYTMLKVEEERGCRRYTVVYQD